MRHAKDLANKMIAKGFREEEAIRVYKAEDAIDKGIKAMKDINGKDIPKEDFINRWFVGEGFHRCVAVSLLNKHLTENESDTINVPAIVITLRQGETLVEWMSEINGSQKEWTRENYVKMAASVHADEPLLQKYDDLVRTKENPTGFSLSTLNHIYCNGKTLSKQDLILLCTGEKKKRKNKNSVIDIIPEYEIEVGDRFIATCKKVGFELVDIRKRYLINQFNNIRDVEDAFKVLNSITDEDIKLMKNENGNLVEQNVIDTFKEIKERVLGKKEKSEPE